MAAMAETSDNFPASERDAMVRAQFGVINGLAMADREGADAVVVGHIEEMWEKSGGEEQYENDPIKEFVRRVGIQMEVDAKITLLACEHLSRATETPVERITQILSQWFEIRDAPDGNDA
jgi:hypothetical protein